MNGRRIAIRTTRNELFPEEPPTASPMSRGAHGRAGPGRDILKPGPSIIGPGRAEVCQALVHAFNQLGRAELFFISFSYFYTFSFFFWANSYSINVKYNRAGSDFELSTT